MSLKSLCLTILSLTCLSITSVAQNWSGIVPSSRAIDWSQAGIVGSLPTRTTICTTINAASYGNGSSDATTAIQNALNSCPSGEVVSLSAGKFRIGGTLSMRSNVTLRGAGP